MSKSLSSASRLRIENRILAAALAEWKCPACGGSGFYSGFSKDAPTGRACRLCISTNGLHRVAHDALEEAHWVRRAI